MIDVTVELQDSHLSIPTFDVSFDDLNSTFVISRISEEDVRTIVGELSLQLLEAKKLHVQLQSMIVGTKVPTEEET